VYNSLAKRSTKQNFQRYSMHVGERAGVPWKRESGRRAPSSQILKADEEAGLLTVAQIGNEEIVRRIIADEITAKEGIPALIDRASGQFQIHEGQYLDYKQQFRIESGASVAEIARDVLAFSNTDGGLLVIGVADDRRVVGHSAIDGRKLRDALGPYIGTRVTFDLNEISVSVQGTTQKLVILHVRRSTNAYSNLLRKEIDLKPGFVKKVKYLKGTLFYRLENETFSESPYEDVEARAHELRFSGAAPRTRTSFLLQEDRPGLRLYAPINDRFFGRESELAELISKFDDPRGRGVSIAGFGGMGKTELAIRLVSELHRRGKFKTIYSASAKQTLLGPSGVQQTDPVFIDLRTFLEDLAGWLGLNLGPMTNVDELSKGCLAEIRRDPESKDIAVH
jgi:Putative DNA-binding domain